MTHKDSKFGHFLDVMNKGAKNGNCNRTACQKPGAVYYNHSTQKYYCPVCAHMLNEVNKADAMKIFGHDLCTKDDEEIKQEK